MGIIANILQFHWGSRGKKVNFQFKYFYQIWEKLHVFLMSTVWGKAATKGSKIFLFHFNGEMVSDQRVIAMSFIIVLVEKFYWLASKIFIQLSVQIYSYICIFPLSVHCHPRFSWRLHYYQHLFVLPFFLYFI